MTESNTKAVHLKKIGEIAKGFNQDELQVILFQVPTHMLSMELERRKEIAFNKIRTISDIVNRDFEDIEQAQLIIRSIKKIV